VFGLSDLTKDADATAPDGKAKLMCSGLTLCGDSSKIGTYLTWVEIQKASKGLIKWISNP
jgi:hypothetical protein